MFVKCGHCKACMMEKANRRKNRIQSELKDGYIYLFVTLTYDRMSCPYVYLDDILNKVDYLNVYRAHTTRIVPVLLQMVLLFIEIVEFIKKLYLIPVHFQIILELTKNVFVV